MRFALAVAMFVVGCSSTEEKGPVPSDAASESGVTTCSWTDDAGTHEEMCDGCCNGAGGGTRCVPRYACVN